MKKLFALTLALCLILSGCSIRITTESGATTELIEGSETPEAFSRLVIAADVADVTVCYGDDWNVEYALPAAPEITLESGTLTFQDKTQNMTIRNVSPSIRVTVPHFTKLETVEITVDVGTVKVKDIETEALTVALDTGDVKLEDILATGVTVQTDVGNADLDRVAAERIDLSVDTGDIEAELLGEEESFTLDLSTDVGEVEVNDRDQGTKYSAGSGARSFTAHAGVGDVEVEFLGPASPRT